VQVQEGKTMSTSILANRAALMTSLKACGYDTHIDSDDDVVFTKDRGTYYIRLHVSRPHVYRIVFPNFHDLASPDEIQAAELIAQLTNERIKVAKIVISRKAMKCSAEAELFCKNPDAFMAIFNRVVSALMSAVTEFRCRTLAED
jgi:hypothetical protein